jgi:Xaa-Pro aminopeptidase
MAATVKVESKRTFGLNGGRGAYVPGELGIRHEDTVAVTESGCENLCPRWSGTPEEPAMP